MDDKLKRLLQEEMKRDADRIMEEVNSDPSLKDVEAPEIIHEKLFQQIREYEEQKAHTQLSEEDKELIRLGKKYKKSRKRGKYLILIAAIVGALGIGVTSFGGPKRVRKQVEGMLAGKEQRYTDTNGDRTGETRAIDEVDAYEQVEQEFGVAPVRLLYLPEEIKYVQLNLWKEMQTAQLIYEDKSEGSLIYRICPNYRTGSTGTGMDDTFLEQYTKEVSGTTIYVKKYLGEETGSKKWNVEFEFQETQYSLLIGGVSEEEVEKIIENLHFSS